LENRISPSDKQRKYLLTFANNLNVGIDYYQDLFYDKIEDREPSMTCISVQLEGCRIVLKGLIEQIELPEESVIC
jgi:hypothetical protein